MASDKKEVAYELLPLLRVFKDGTVERCFGSTYLPPSSDPTTGVTSKDITISSAVSARLYLPKITNPNQKLPIFIYFHGGGFCLGSAFSPLEHNYMNTIVSESKALTVSVEYRLAPEHFLPTAYEDSWVSLQWVASHFINSEPGTDPDPWLIKHGDFNRVYLGGDSAGANIVHYLAMRAGTEKLNGDMKIKGGFLSHPYFCGSKPIGSEPIATHEQSLGYRVWGFVYPTAVGGIDNPMMNPFVGDGPSLAGLGCSRLLVCVSEKDELRERGVRYCEAVRESGWKGEVELVDVEGEGHCFHVVNLEAEKAKNLIKRMASFIME